MPNDAHDAGKHEFSLYVPELSSQVVEIARKEVLTIGPGNLFHRIVNVLRLRPPEIVTLFDEQIHIQCSLTALKNGELLLTPGSAQNNEIHRPTLIFTLPLLKRDALNHAVYTLTALGISAIHLVTSEKSSPLAPSADRIQERLRKICIAACEQSKQYRIPILTGPLSLDESLHNAPLGTLKLCGQRNAVPLMSICAQNQFPDSISLITGPEAGFNTAELYRIQNFGFQLGRLSNSVLRSEEAASLLAGAVRCYYLEN